MAAEHRPAKQVIRGYNDDFLLIVVTFPSPTTGEESALDGAAQAAPPGVVLVDAGAARRDEEAVGSNSQDTHFSQIQWSLFSLFHPRFKRSFPCGFLWFFAVILAVFFLLSCLFGVFCRKICTMFLLLVSCSRLLTHWDDGWASRRLVLQNCSFSKICWGQPCLAIVSAPVLLAIFGACIALPHIIL